MVNKCNKFTKTRYIILIIYLTIVFVGLTSKVNAQRYVMTYLYGNDDYITMIEERGNNFNEVSPSYFDITEEGNLKVNYINQNFVKEMQSQNIKVVPFFSNHWDRESGRKALENYEKTASALAKAVKDNGLDGVNIDVENLTELDRENYVNLIKMLRAKMPSDKLVVVSVAANPCGIDYGWQGSYDYKELAKYADYLMIMAYDEHYEGGENGPVASINFVEKSIKYALTRVEKEKIVLGIPLYGRYWNKSTNAGGYGVSLTKIENILKKYVSEIVYDKASESVKATVTIKSTDEALNLNGKSLNAGKYIFWYENKESIDAKLDMIEKYNIKGVGMWKVGLETSSIWDTIENKFSEVIATIKQSFKDVKMDYWAYEDIEFVYENGLMIGKSEKIFEAESNLTRAELVTVIVRIIEKTEFNLVKSKNSVKFVDISEHWAKEDIIKLSEYGLVKGYEDGKFKADSIVTRAEASTLVARLLEKIGRMEKISSGISYIDLSESHWAFENIIELRNNGILSGYEDGSFRPQKGIKRAEIAKIIRKVYEKLI